MWGQVKLTLKLYYKSKFDIFFSVMKLSIKWELKNLPLQYFCENSKKYTSYMVTVVCVLNLLSCPTLCDSMHCNPPGCSVHGILQARILVWAAMPSSRDLPDPGIKPTSLTSSSLAGRVFITSITWEFLVMCLLAKDIHSMWAWPPQESNMTETGLRVVVLLSPYI